MQAATDTKKNVNYFKILNNNNKKHPPNVVPASQTHFLSTFLVLNKFAVLCAKKYSLCSFASK